jgi:RNA polymerase primary sigma factor
MMLDVVGHADEEQEALFMRYGCSRCADKFLNGCMIAALMKKEDDVFFSELCRYPPLSRSEEQDLARRAQAKDRAAREQLILSNIRFVVSIAKHFSTNGLLPDLVLEGVQGLCKAIDRYDPSSGHRLQTYAGWWIKQAIRRSLLTYALIRLPDYQALLRRRIASIVHEHNTRTGTEPSVDALAKQLIRTWPNAYSAEMLSPEKLAAMRRAHRAQPVSLDQLELDVADTAQQSRYPEEREDMIQTLEYVLRQTLSPREEEVIKARYGIRTSPQTLVEIAQKLQVSRERVRQIQGYALAKLRNSRYLDLLARLMQPDHETVFQAHIKHACFHL